MKKQLTRWDRDKIEEMIGDPKRVDAELQEFRKDVKALSSCNAMLIDKYTKRWIAFYRGKVQADARSLNEILAEVDRLGLPRESVIVRYIDRNTRTMIV